MLRIILAFVFLLGYVWGSGEISAAKYARLVVKGEKIALRLCDHKKLPKLSENATPESIAKLVESSGACPPLSRSKMEALAMFLKAGGQIAHKQSGKEIAVPKGAKCPVCGMFVAKYPKWGEDPPPALLSQYAP